MRITESDNLRDCVDYHVSVSGFDIYDSIIGGKIEDLYTPLMVINVSMSKPRNDLAHIKIYVFKNRSIELNTILTYVQNLNANVFQSSYDVCRLLNNYIHTHINYLDGYVVQYYTINL